MLSTQLCQKICLLCVLKVVELSAVSSFQCLAINNKLLIDISEQVFARTACYRLFYTTSPPVGLQFVMDQWVKACQCQEIGRDEISEHKVTSCLRACWCIFSCDITATDSIEALVKNVAMVTATKNGFCFLYSWQNGVLKTKAIHKSTQDSHPVSLVTRLGLLPPSVLSLIHSYVLPHWQNDETPVEVSFLLLWLNVGGKNTREVDW